MNLQKTLIFSFVIGLLVTSCSTEKKKVDEEKVIIEESVKTEAPHDGFATIPELTESFINSVKDNSFDDYTSHAMTREEEHNQSKKITDDNIRHEFLNEFDFNLSHEEEEFRNMVQYLADNDIDLHKLHHEETLILDYKENKYAPVQVKEVIAPILHDDLEVDLIYMVINIEGRWFLSSELSI